MGVSIICAATLDTYMKLKELKYQETVPLFPTNGKAIAVYAGWLFSIGWLIYGSVIVFGMEPLSYEDLAYSAYMFAYITIVCSKLTLLNTYSITLN